MDIRNLYTPEGMKDIIQSVIQPIWELLAGSWLAYSATNVIFHKDADGVVRVFLGLRKVPAESIPEAGDYCLVGGFNWKTGVKLPAMFADVADAHLKAQTGIVLDADRASVFLPCEYNMRAILQPLSTPFGDFNIKRVAFDRLVWLTDAEKAAMTPQGKIKDGVWLTEAEFQDMLADAGEKISFPYQVRHVLEGFHLVDKLSKPADLAKMRPMWGIPTAEYEHAA